MTLLNKWRQHSRTQVLHVRIGWCCSSVGEKMGRLDSDLMKHKRTNDTVDCHDAKLLQIIRSCNEWKLELNVSVYNL